jgi:capsular polysaccharide biosynthesis protein
MDLALFLRVIWRFKFLVFGGVILAIALATFSLAKVSIVHGKPKLTYRKTLTYESGATVLITQRGFPWGSVSANASAASRLTSLASFYAQLASSDAVKERLHLQPGNTGGVTARPVVDMTTGYGLPLPMLEIDGISTSPRGAVELTTSATRAFISYVAQQQQAAGTAPQNRVVLQVMNPAQAPVVVAPRKKTLPIMIFMLVLTAAVGLAFILENLRPSVRVVSDQADADSVRPQPAVGTLAQQPSSSAKSA